MPRFKKFKKPELSRYVSEFAGTFILIAVIKLSFGSYHYEDISPYYAPFAVGITLMMLVYNYGYISMAMFNPAVTISQIIRDSDNFRRDNFRMWITYFIVQFVGGIAGGFFAAIIGGHDACMIYPKIADGTDKYQSFLAEFFFTSILCTLNLHLATDKRVDGNQFYGIAIGSCLFVAIICIGSITGCAINPAVWTGCIASAAYCKTDNDGTLVTKDAWIYWIAHIFAGWFSGVWFMFFYGSPECFGDNDHRYDTPEVSDSYDSEQEELTTSDKGAHRSSI